MVSDIKDVKETNAPLLAAFTFEKTAVNFHKIGWLY
jgi:hypothetical protein